MAEDLAKGKGESALLQEISTDFSKDKHEDGLGAEGLSKLSKDNDANFLSQEFLAPVICPYMGSRQDRGTKRGYAHSHNCCYRHGQSTLIAKSTQLAYCLTRDYASCATYQEKSPIESSAEIRARRMKKASPSAAIVSILLIVLAALVWWSVPGINIGESIGRAAPLHWKDDNLQPQLSHKIVVTKASAQPTPIAPQFAIDAVNIQPDSSPIATTAPDPKSDVVIPYSSEESEETSDGGFRVFIYD